jgi:deoxyribodipyrimidine photo-lyase
MTSTVLWFRRDLRLADHPALVEAAAQGPVVALFVLDPALLGPSGPTSGGLGPAGGPRTAFLVRSLRALDESLGGRLVVRTGDPVEIVPALADEAGAEAVFVTADFGPYGRRRDSGVGRALKAAGRRLTGVGSPYAVDPGQVRKQDGTAFRVFTPFYRAWRDAGWPAPSAQPPVRWAASLPSDGIPDDPPLGASLPPAGEEVLQTGQGGRLAGQPASRHAR